MSVCYTFTGKPRMIKIKFGMNIDIFQGRTKANFFFKNELYLVQQKIGLEKNFCMGQKIIDILIQLYIII